MLFTLVFFIVGISVYAWFYEPKKLAVSEYSVSGKTVFAGRILLLSDFHLGSLTSIEDLSDLIRQLTTYLNKAPVDILLLGGDYLDSNPKYLPKLALLLENIHQLGLPTYAVFGNHDHSTCEPIDPLEKILVDSGCTVLRNNAVRITVRGKEILLVGIEDLEQDLQYHQHLIYKNDGQYQHSVRKMSWYQATNKLFPELPRVILVHNPDGVYMSGALPLAVLSGHTHGGQLLPVYLLGRYLPWLLHFLLPAGSFRTRSGRMLVNGRTVIVSRGLGGSALPARFLKPPEAIIVEFV